MTAIRQSLSTFVAWLAQDLGRLYVAVFGGCVAVAGLTLAPTRNTVANTALVVGGILVALGSLVPWFRHARWKHGEVEFEDPAIQRERVRSALRVSEEQRTPGVAVEASGVRDATRYYVATHTLRALFHEVPGYSECSLRLFMYDDLRERLVAVLTSPEPSAASKEWKSGEGVTGVSYKNAEYVIAVGDSTHDDTYGLDRESQERYSNLTEVAAAPVKNASGRVVGVLSVSHSASSTILNTSNGRTAHIRAAAACGRIIVDLLGWRSDD